MHAFSAQYLPELPFQGRFPFVFFDFVFCAEDSKMSGHLAFFLLWTP
jgi:hypothetical protein